MDHLGFAGKDVITGFRGVITGQVRYLTGCDQLLLQPRAQGPQFFEPRWFDETRIKRQGKGQISINASDRAESGELEDHAHGPDAEAPRK